MALSSKHPVIVPSGSPDGFRPAVLVAVLVTVLLGGCRTHVPRYADEGAAPAGSAATHPIAVAVAPFVITKGLVTVPAQDAITQQLAAAKVFAKQEVVAPKFLEPSAEHLGQLRALNYDAVLIGRFHKVDVTLLPTGPAAADLLNLLGIPGIVAYEALRGSGKRWLLSAELDQLRLIDTSLGRVLWQGRAPGAVITQGPGYPGAGLPDTFLWMDLALKSAVEALIKQLQGASLR